VKEGKGFSDSYWLVEPDSRVRGLFKIPKFNKDYSWYGGDHWAEKIVSELGAELNLNMPVVDLAVYKNYMGCISYNFLSKQQSLKEGMEVMSVEVTKDKRGNYILSNILNSLAEYNLVDEFIELLIFDAFVGQTDRHEENWGIVLFENKEIVKLAPIYDNASCLARERLPKHVKQLLNDNNYFKSYLHKCKSCIKLESRSDLSQFEMAKYLFENYPELFNGFANKLKKLLDMKINNIVSKIPINYISENQKELVIKILINRKNWILDLSEEGSD